jgi:hypothetical protein
LNLKAEGITGELERIHATAKFEMDGNGTKYEIPYFNGQAQKLSRNWRKYSTFLES